MDALLFPWGAFSHYLLKIKVEILNNERHIRSHWDDTVHECIDQNIESIFSVLNRNRALKSALVHVDIPVAQIMQKTKLFLKHCIESVVAKLLMYKAQYVLYSCKNPFVKSVSKIIRTLLIKQIVVKYKGFLSLVFKSVYLLIYESH